MSPTRRSLRSLPATGLSVATMGLLASLVVPSLSTGSAQHPTGNAIGHGTPGASPGPPHVGTVIRPRLAGEGIWRAGSYRVGGSVPIRVMTFRPDPANPGLTAYVAWIDHASTRLALYPGYANPPVAQPRGPAEIPSDQRWRLLATFNGGFKWAWGPAGFLINGVADEPLVRGLGTVVAHPSGRVDIVDWQGPSTLGRLDLARQNLPLLVDHGRPAANVVDVGAWGATIGGVSAVWRSALGIDANGNLLYAAANSQTPSSLAALMIHVGAKRAIQLDINPTWVSFYSYLMRGAQDPLQFVPNPNESRYRWLSPDSRDFFAVYTRAGGGARVPFR